MRGRGVRGSGDERAVRGGCSSGMQARAQLEVGARVRTANMVFMSVTLDVSRLSSWLNTDAACRVARWAYNAGSRCGSGDERAVRGGCSSRMQARARQEIGARVRT